LGGSKFLENIESAQKLMLCIGGKQMRVIVPAMLVLVTASTLVYAQGLEIGVVPFKAVGQVMTASEAREAPPYGPFNLFVGKEIKKIEQGTELKIVGKKTYSGFSGTHVWYQIQPIEKQRDQPSTASWVYGGVEGKSPQVKLETIK
jgi:hypothetical protein